MKEKNMSILNRYGALSSADLKKLLERIEELEKVVDNYRSTFVLIYSELFGIDIDVDKEWHFMKKVMYDKHNGQILPMSENQSIRELFNDEMRNNKSILKKMKELTHADDYEYVTETKLVKKNKENK